MTSAKEVNKVSVLTPVLENHLLWDVLSWKTPASTNLQLSSYRLSHGIIPHENCVITKIGFYLENKTGAGSNLAVEIWSDSGGDPDAVIANGSVIIAVENLVASSMNWCTFATPPSLTGGTKYHVVFRGSDIAAGNYWDLYVYDGFPANGLGWWGPGSVGQHDTGGGWSVFDSPITAIYGRKV